MHYTRDQVLKLAPDDASAKAGQQLATNAKWVTKNINSRALWGDCQGSGKTPYKTIIDLENIAFKCSCPSRKFPCKHGLGLMLFYTQDPSAFNTTAELPAHVAEWLDKRAEKEISKVQKEDKPVDELAKQKRSAAREKKVEAGIAELRAWIKDVVRGGIMNVPQQIYQFNQHITARMVDAQAGGLATQLRQINKINFYQDGWQRLLIKRLSLIYLLTEAYNNVEKLPIAMVKELQTLIGWTTAKEDVLLGSEVNDIWIILSITTNEEANITTERIWLYGKESKSFALVLSFYAGNQLPQHLLFSGIQIDAAIVYFPGLLPLRALIKTQQALPQQAMDLKASIAISDVYELITQQLSQNPFLAQIPFILNEVNIIFKDSKWFLSDQQQEGFEIANPDAEAWDMLAFTKGKSCACFGIYEDEQFHLHTLWIKDQIFFVK